MQTKIFTLTLIFISHICWAQCPSPVWEHQEITYSTQSQVDNFKINYPACTAAPNLRLRIDGVGVTNLDGLSNLTILRNLTVQDTRITSLSGISNLIEVQSLVLISNDFLFSLSGMTNLRKIGGLDIGSSKLTNLSGLENVESVGYGTLIFNSFLEDVSALSGLPGATGRTDIFGNPRLSDCSIEFFCKGVVVPAGMLGAQVEYNAPGCNSASEIRAKCAVFPVVLADFKATVESATVMLTWTTTSESNSSHFAIERSANGKTWSNIGNVKSRENSSISNTYMFVDRTPAAGHSYYRLKMVDMDQTFAYSSIQGADMGMKADIVFPNPVTDQLYFNGIELSDMEEVVIYNELGDKMKITENIHDGISVKHLQAGLYVLKIMAKSGLINTYKIIKK